MNDLLINISNAVIQSVSTLFHRFLFNKISLDARLVGIIGQRGVGKTTLLLQIIRERMHDIEGVMYVKLDDIYFSMHSVTDFAKSFVQQGGKMLVLDNLHKYQGIVSELREITGGLPELKILFASSSVWTDDGSFYELSKIAELHYLPGLSYREFLEFKYGFVFQVVEMDELLEFNRTPGADVLHSIHPLQYFNDYLTHGYYPFTVKRPEFYYSELREQVNRILTDDFSSVHRIDFDSVLKIRRILSVIALNGPLKPNIEGLADTAGTSRDSLLKFLKYLHQAGIIGWLTKGYEDVNYFNKPDRLLMNNSCLAVALSDNMPISVHLHESFMHSQLRISHQLNIAAGGSYLIDLEYGFTLANSDHYNGVGRGRKTLRNTAGYIIDPGSETRSGNSIPLWMIGFLY